MNVRAREIVIDALAASGDGLAHLDGRSVHVPDALPGERVTVEVSRGELRVVERVESSPERVTPRCPVFDRCGGCAWQHASEGLQRDARLTLLRRALPAELREHTVTWHASDSPWRWRTRARLAWEVRRGVTSLGFRARRSRDVVAITECPVLDARLEPALVALTRSLDLVARRGEVSIALGRNGAPVASVHPEGELADGAYKVGLALVEQGFAGVALWVPGATVASTTGDPRPVMEGPDGRALLLAVDGFAQAHPSLNRALAAAVLRHAEPAGRKVLELYAGSGNFTVLLARDASAVTAVESDPGAVAALRENLSARALSTVSVRQEASEACAGAKADVVVLDPPRTGAREVAEILARRSDLRAVVYVSCDPATLGRDLGILSKRYELRALEAFEMFPQTGHVEVVAALVARSRAGRV